MVAPNSDTIREINPVLRGTTAEKVAALFPNEIERRHAEYILELALKILEATNHYEFDYTGNDLITVVRRDITNNSTILINNIRTSSELISPARLQETIEILTANFRFFNQTRGILAAVCV